jgi:hypothetical protein
MDREISRLPENQQAINAFISENKKAVESFFGQVLKQPILSESEVCGYQADRARAKEVTQKIETAKKYCVDLGRNGCWIGASASLVYGL